MHKIKVMQIRVKGSAIAGRVMLPSSKSISNRALIINALSGCSEPVGNVSDCDDTKVMVRWLGERPSIIDIGPAGTAMRFSAALLAVEEGEHVITGSERMKNRPIGLLVNALRKLGADVEYVEKEGFPPLCIKGCSSMEGGELRLPGNVSSQYVSALLMIAPCLKKGLKLFLTNTVVSRPYIDMTMAIMREYGAVVDWAECEDASACVVVKPVPYKSHSFQVENDWSAASYWYEMVALAPNADVEIVLPVLYAKSLQGDSSGAQVFELLGVRTRFIDDGIVLTKKGDCVSYLEYDFLEMPDLAQTFVVTCCMLGVPFHFRGLQSLKIKETDRIVALQRELAKLGFKIESRNDCELLWDGSRCEDTENIDAPVVIDTYEDHRMAMAFAPVALKKGSVLINEPQVVSKSYPRYWLDLESVGMEICMIE